jgi:hypothetical protein
MPESYKPDTEKLDKAIQDHLRDKLTQAALEYLRAEDAYYENVRTSDVRVLMRQEAAFDAMLQAAEELGEEFPHIPGSRASRVKP